MLVADLIHQVIFHPVHGTLGTRELVRLLYCSGGDVHLGLTEHRGFSDLVVDSGAAIRNRPLVMQEGNHLILGRLEEIDDFEADVCMVNFKVAHEVRRSSPDLPYSQRVEGLREVVTAHFDQRA